MMMARTRQKITTADVLEIVKRHVERHQTPEHRLKVLDQAVMHVAEGIPEARDRWYVAVRAEPEDEGRFEWYSDVTMKISDEIKEEEDLDVYLQSILPHY